MKKYFILFIALLCIINLSISQTKIENNQSSKIFIEKNPKNALSLLALDTLPANFPVLTVDSLNNPAPGYIFLNSISFGDEGSTINYNIVLDSQGKVFYYNRPFPGGVDFKMQPNGLFSYGSPIKLGDKYQVGPILVQSVMVIENILDSSFKKIDNAQMKNGYLADIHDFQILPNGNYLFVGYETNPTDMSKLVKGGNPNAMVIGTVFQELDHNKKCVFQWRSMDYIPILETRDNPLNATFEHVHGNSMFLDNDGNLIVSLPVTLEIIKIDMITGKILWHFGGIHNQFEFIGENEANKPIYFSMQHDAHRLKNGNMLLYDNGLTHEPWYSRAVEYSFDEINKKAEMVWEYRHTPDISAYAMGSVQRMANGNTLIDWGLIYTEYKKTMTEVTPDKKIAFELSMPEDAYSYRAYKYNLPACQPIAEINRDGIIIGNTYHFKDQNSNTGVEIYINTIDAASSNSINVKKYDCSPLNPQFNGEAPVIINCRFTVTGKNINLIKSEIGFDLTSLPRHHIPDSMKVYFRPIVASGIFSELPAYFDTEKNQIVAESTEFGEYIIGFERYATEIMPPALQSPVNKKMLINNTPAALLWSPTGRYDFFRLQIAEDEQFINIVKDESNLINTLDTITLNNNKTYYWRVKTFYRNLESNWSEIRSYSYAEPFINITTPVAKEIWIKDSTTNIIRWETNLADSLSITLYRNGVKQSQIKDILYSYTNAFYWEIPKNIAEDSTYTIQIRSKKDTNKIAVSENYFTIKNSSTDVNDEPNNTNSSNELNIIPNPSSEYSKLNFKINKSGITKLQIIDQFGNIQQTLIDSFMIGGSYSLGLNTGNLQPGIYFCLLKDTESSIVEKIIVIR